MTPRASASIARERAQISVYLADTRDLCAKHIDALVTDSDRERVDTRMSPRRSVQYLAGRALVRSALERATGRPARSHRLTTRPGGKLDCADGPPISLSHSGTLIACAVAPEGEVGIDVQVADPRRHTDEIARLHFSAAERDWLHAAPSDAFYLLWVLKEAYLKCLGCGLAGGLDLLECRVEPPFIEMRAATPAQLAVYFVGNAFVGLATTGAALGGVHTERWLPSAARSRALPMQPFAATASA